MDSQQKPARRYALAGGKRPTQGTGRPANMGAGRGKNRVPQAATGVAGPGQAGTAMRACFYRRPLLQGASREKRQAVLCPYADGRETPGGAEPASAGRRECRDAVADGRSTRAGGRPNHRKDGRNNALWPATGHGECPVYDFPGHQARRNGKNSAKNQGETTKDTKEHEGGNNQGFHRKGRRGRKGRRARRSWGSPESRVIAGIGSKSNTHFYRKGRRGRKGRRARRSWGSPESRVIAGIGSKSNTHFYRKGRRGRKERRSRGASNGDTDIGRKSAASGDTEEHRGRSKRRFSPGEC